MSHPVLGVILIAVGLVVVVVYWFATRAWWILLIIGLVLVVAGVAEVTGILPTI